MHVQFNRGYGGARHIRTNQELKNLYQERDIVKHIKTLRLEWLGHLIRMQNIRVPQVALDTKQEGKRKVGIPRWLYNIQADFKMKGLEECRSKTQELSE